MWEASSLEDISPWKVKIRILEVPTIDANVTEYGTMTTECRAYDIVEFLIEGILPTMD